jgi:multiple sugar transport system ATP-binding protein
MAEVELRDIRKSFGDVETIHGIDMHIASGEFTVFVGPSGCGKSTLLRLIAGLEEITSGEMLIAGERVNDRPPAERGIAMVFQSYALYPHMTVYENMAFGLRLAKRSEQEIDQRVRKAAGILQVEHLLDRKPKQLSGGQRQRIAIGRAIVREPRVFLFDEPLSNLDAALRIQMRMEIGRLHNQLGATMVYVTHDQVEAMTMADKIVVLNAGNLEQHGAPLELYHYPRNLFVAGFIGSPKMNFLAATLESADARGAQFRLADGTVVTAEVDAREAAPGDRVTLGIRPEHFDLTPDTQGARLSGEVQVVEQLGDSTLINIGGPALESGLVVRFEGNRFVHAGEVLTVGLPEDQVHAFDDAGLAFPRTASHAGLTPPAGAKVTAPA